MTENTRRVAVITGAGGGLGGAAAHLLAADGVDLALIDIRREPLDQIRSLVEAAGVSGLAIEADLKSAASCEAVGRVDSRRVRTHRHPSELRSHPRPPRTRGLHRSRFS